MKCPSRSLVVFSMLFALQFGGMLVIASNGMATEYSKASVLFLLISPSARINGMGEAGVAVPDEPMGYYNPATPALYTRGYNITYVADTGRTGWLPALASDIYYSFSGIQIGADLTALRPFFRGREEGMASEPAGLFHRLKRNVSVGVALSRYKTEFDMGTQIRTNEYGVEIGSFRSMDKATNTVISANAHFLADFSAGMTLIDYESDLGPFGAGMEKDRVKAKGSARNYGLMIRLPLVRALETLSGHSVKLPNRLRPVLESTYGVSWNNRGDDVCYIEARQADPLPRNRKSGYSLKLGLCMDYRGTSLDLFRVLIAAEKERTQIPSSKRSDVTDKIGFEQEVLETLVFRWGKYDDTPGHVRMSTEGVTIKSDGLMKILGSLYSDGNIADPGILTYVASHLSIAWHKSTYEADHTPLDGSEFEQFTLSLSF
ncbi:MAG: hypothetical protein V1800_14150 [Candidatus Latescibacterota bacterium]